MIYIKDRIKTIRKILKLTQQDFADRIHIGRNSVGRYEMGDREPSDAIIYSICREFNISEEWLRTGEGEMFAFDATARLDALAAAHNLGHDQRILIEKFILLSPETQKAVLDYLKDVVNSIKNEESPDEPEDLHAELDRQLELEKEPEEKSEVS